MKLKWEVPKLVDFNSTANGGDLDNCKSGSSATYDCEIGGLATGLCSGGGSPD